MCWQMEKKLQIQYNYEDLESIKIATLVFYVISVIDTIDTSLNGLSFIIIEI